MMIEGQAEQTAFDQPVRVLDLIALYKKMYLIRRAEETILDLCKAEKIFGSVHLCVGQESAPV